MKKYDTYKNSGIEWIGEIPEHWKFLKLGYLLEANDGGVWGKDNGTSIVLRSTEINADGTWNFEEKPAQRLLNEKEIEKALLIKGDLLVTKSSGSAFHIGKTAIVNDKVAKMNCCYSNFMQRLRLKNSFVPKLYFYFLNSSLARKQFNYLSNTTTGLVNLGAEILSNVIVPLPPPAEQTAIASYLDQKTAEIDQLIADKKNLLELYEEEKTALINDLVTGKRIYDGNTWTEPSQVKNSGIDWLGEIPVHWNSVSLKWVSNIYSGGTPSRKKPEYWNNGIIPWLNSGTVNQFFITEPSEFITVEGLNNSSAKWIPKGAILIALAGQGKTKGMVAQAMFECTCNQSLGIIVPNEKIENRFLLYYLKSNYQNIRNLGGGDKRDGINLVMIGGIYVPLIPIEEQKTIVNFIESESKRLETKIQDTQNLIELLKEYKEALISELVTGKVKVV